MEDIAHAWAHISCVNWLNNIWFIDMYKKNIDDQQKYIVTGNLGPGSPMNVVFDPSLNAK